MIKQLKVMAIPKDWNVPKLTKAELQTRIAQAVKLGQAAHQAGKAANKAADLELTKLWGNGQNLSPKEVMAIMKAWDKGWFEEHMKRD